MEADPRTLGYSIDDLPELLREPASRWLGRFDDEHGVESLPDELIAPIVKIAAISNFAGKVLLREWQAIHNDWRSLRGAFDKLDLTKFVQEFSAGGVTDDEAKSRLRRFRNRYLLTVLARELSGKADVEESLTALSLLADRLLEASALVARERLRPRFGEPVDTAGVPIPIVVLAMGKLGGCELNFSSDIDLIFLYPCDGDSDGPRRISAHEYFTRLSRGIIALLDEVTADGFAFRIDTRLRPFGDSGPPVVNFSALESYLLQHGRDWERYAYVKARVVGPRPDPEIERDLFDNLVTPFVYRRYLDYGVFESLREMHAMITAEVRRRDLADDVKLGPGGIREIEFIVQSLQLVRGGNRPELQNQSLLKVLPGLVNSRGFDADAVETLGAAYRFLRRLENFIQALDDQQTHELPEDPIDRARLAFAMDYPHWEALLEDLAIHRRAVTQQFDAIALRESDDVSRGDAMQRFSELWESCATAENWCRAFDTFGYAQSERLAEIIEAFRSAPATQRSDTLASERIQRFVPLLLRSVRQTEDPVLALSRTLTVVDSVLRRSAYLALLNENRIAAERLVSLCGRSSYIAGQIARYPVLLDELLDPRIYSEHVGKEELQIELAADLARKDVTDSETQMEFIAQFQRATLFRIAVADFSGKLPIMKVSDSLTYLAEAVLAQAVDRAWQDLVAKHGAPYFEEADVRSPAGFAVIAYGKLGGLELSYGSDLDLVFLHDSRGEKQLTDGEKPLENSVFFARLVRRLVHCLTTRTSSGVLYEVDTRLRPSGGSGLLVTSSGAFERYQEENAWTWEHQALLRARPVAGSPAVAAEFDRIRADTLTSRVRLDSLRADVLSMRRRMRRELDRSDENLFDLKQGRGGISDIEFIVQYLVLSNAQRHASVFHYTDNIRQLEALAGTGCIPASVGDELAGIYRRFRRRAHHLVLNDRPLLVGASEFVEERVSVNDIWGEYLEECDPGRSEP